MGSASLAKLLLDVQRAIAWISTTIATMMVLSSKHDNSGFVVAGIHPQMTREKIDFLFARCVSLRGGANRLSHQCGNKVID
jgi:hypothetical protein